MTGHSFSCFLMITSTFIII